MPTGKGQLRIAIEDFLQTFTIKDRINGWIRDGIHEFIRGLNTDIIKAIDALKKSGAGISDDPYQSWYPQSLGLGGELLFGLGLILAIVTTFGNALTGPIANLITQAVDSAVHSQKLGIATFINLLRMYPDEAAKFVDEADYQGFNNTRVQAMFLAGNQEINIGQLIALKLRGHISLDEYHKRALKAGYDEQRSEDLLNIAMVIPTPNDLIYLAVKEAFDDTSSEKFQHDEGFPVEFGDWAVKQGMTIDWAKKYWRAHWQLPSPQQVFEMLQRLREGKSDTPVTMDDVKTFLKMADYSPFWRERLTQISYSPFTRVDIRRMYKTKDLDENGVLDAYQDAGYDLEHAEKLKNFTIHYEAEEETQLGLSTITNAYTNGSIERGEAEEKLDKYGYDANSIAFILDNIDYKHKLEVVDIQIQNAKSKYLDGIIDETSVYSELGGLKLSSDKIKALVDLWTTQRNNQISLPTLAQIEQFYELGIATLDDFKRILHLRGYSNETVEWNIRRIDIEKQAKAKKDADDADKEMSKLLLNKESSQYQIDKADIDLAIAQARAEITDIDVALHGDISDDDANTLFSRKDELKQFITQMNVEKAKLKFDYQTEKDRLTSSPQNEG